MRLVRTHLLQPEKEEKRMAEGFRILVASDGSPSALAALETGLAFPWPSASTARGLVALHPPGNGLGRIVRAAMTQGLREGVAPLKKSLARRWVRAEVRTPREAPAAAILGEARRYGADAIVLGWRGHGALRRLLAGSVSRTVAARAHCAVLVSRTAHKDVRRLVLGLDGTANARRAVRLVERLAPPRGNRVFLVHVLTPVPVITLGRVPAQTRVMVRQEVARLNAANRGRAEKRLRAAAAALKRSGWNVTPVLRAGDPLDTLLEVARDRRADALVVGASGKSGVARTLLGSVAAGVLDIARIPVFIAR